MKALILWLLPVGAVAQDPSLLLRQSADVLAAHRSYRRESLTTTEITGSLAQRSEVPVLIALQRPARLRIESGPRGSRMTMVSDGSHSWMYLEPGGEYIQRSAGVSAAALIGESGLSKQLPDFEAALQSTTIEGEDTIAVGEKSFPCWIVLKRYGPIEVPSQEMTVRDATERVWIGKSEHVLLKSIVEANVAIGKNGEQAKIVQTTLTLALELDVELPDSLFHFTPPKGAKQVADWSLPGVSRPDVVGKLAPVLRAEAIGGGKVDLATMRGQVIVIDFWATWCGPCKLQLPILEKLHRESGVTVIGVTVGEDAAAVAAYLKKTGITFPNAALQEESDFVRRFDVSGFPTTVIIDPNGTVVSYEVGQQPEEALRARITRAAGK